MLDLKQTDPTFPPRLTRGAFRVRLPQSRSVLAPGTPSLAQQQLFAPSTTEATDAIDRRNAEIQSIAQSIADLADMFKDLSSLVIDQGTLLDRVDWNVEQMNTEVKGAVKELTQATRSVCPTFRG